MVHDSVMRQEVPLMVFWRVGRVVLSSVYGPLADLAESRDKDSCRANHNVCRRSGRPVGATGWRTHAHAAWQPMATCPIPDRPPKDNR